MNFPPGMGRSKKWLRWIRTQPEAQECLFCTRPATDICHIEHGSSRQTDFLVYPACHEHHIQLDHSPRSSHRLLTLAQERKILAYWLAFTLPTLFQRFFGETDADPMA